MPYNNLNTDNGYIWRIVHRNNIPWILDNGLHCRNSEVQDPNYINIGNVELIDKRAHRVVPIEPGGTLNDYVPFYFTPFSIMMYNIYTGVSGVVQRQNQEICILVSQLPRIVELNISFVFTDRHAYPPTANYYDDLENLDQIDWPRLQARDFRIDPEDPEKKEKYQAEALIYQHVPIDALLGIVCYNQDVKTNLDQEAQQRNLTLDIRVIPNWYF